METDKKHIKSLFDRIAGPEGAHRVHIDRSDEFLRAERGIEAAARRNEIRVYFRNPQLSAWTQRSLENEGFDVWEDGVCTECERWDRGDACTCSSRDDDDDVKATFVQWPCNAVEYVNCGMYACDAAEPDPGNGNLPDGWCRSCCRCRRIICRDHPYEYDRTKPNPIQFRKVLRCAVHGGPRCRIETERWCSHPECCTKEPEPKQPEQPEPNNDDDDIKEPEQQEPNNDDDDTKEPERSELDGDDDDDTKEPNKIERQ